MKQLIYFLLPLLIFSCRESVIDLKIDEPESALVIGGFINTDSAVTIKVTRTVASLATDVNYVVPHANVLLYENDILVSEFLFDTNGSDSEVDDAYISINNFTPHEGNTYTLAVEAAGYATISANTQIPQRVELEDAQIGDELVQVGQYLNGVNAQVTFKDPAGEANFYSIVVIEKRNIYNEYDENGQPIIESGLTVEKMSKALRPRLDNKIEFNGKSDFQFGTIYLSDLAFDGLDYTYKFLMHVPDQNSELTIFLNHITEAQYLYGTTSQLQQLEAAENPFAQPVQVYSNVQNGLGIFTGYQSSAIVINKP